MTTDSKIRPQPGIEDIELYVGGESKIAGSVKNRVIKLSSNENPFGASDAAIDAYKAVAGEIATYPSSDHAELRMAIGEVHGVDPARVICGNGSDEVITFLCQVYAGPGDEVLYPEHGFSMYRICAQAAGATPVIAPETDRTVDVDKLLAACTERTKLIFIANPNNPTGTMISNAEVLRLAEEKPEGAILVLDGAYAEYVEEEAYDAGLALIEARDDVVMTRTFSKIYGLGGLRVGWGYGPQHIIDNLNRVRGPFNVSAAGLAAAEVAVRDVKYTAKCKAANTKWREWLADQLRGLNVAIDDSHGNFVLARFADLDQMEAVDTTLKDDGIITRKVTGYGFPEGLRITVGDEISCRRVVAAIRRTLEGVE